mgnify:CR=1 FL=1
MCSSDLIINELMSNSLKYAFQDGRDGYIKIGLKEVGEEVVILVEDNGVGLAKHINFENSNTLGLQLVHTLTDQLDGTLNYKSAKDKGVEFELRFKKV